jgi:hypothetical protein
MLGSRAIWHEGWKAVTTHPTISGAYIDLERQAAAMARPGVAGLARK